MCTALIGMHVIVLVACMHTSWILTSGEQVKVWGNSSGIIRIILITDVCFIALIHSEHVC